jgi:hypothetical protein
MAGSRAKKTRKDAEIDEYLQSDIVDTKPEVFWQKHNTMFPKVVKLPKQYLAIPARSGSVERLFSIAGPDQLHSLQKCWRA